MSVHYTRARVPRKREDFPYAIATDVPIAPSGQLCFDVQMPTPTVPAAQSGTAPEYGVFLFSARDPATNAMAFHVRAVPPLPVRRERDAADCGCSART